MDGTVNIRITVRKYTLKEFGHDIIYLIVLIAFFTNELSKRFLGLSVPGVYHRIVGPAARVVDIVYDFVKKVLLAILLIMIGMIAFAYSAMVVAAVLGYL